MGHAHIRVVSGEQLWGQSAPRFYLSIYLFIHFKKKKEEKKGSSVQLLCDY